MKSPMVALAALTALAALAQRPPDILWAPKPPQAPRYTPPHKPHTKLSDVKAKHAGHAAWREPVVDDDLLHAEYIQSAPGAKVSRRLHPDTAEWWVVLDGQIRWEIEGQEPFVASQGWIVYVPMQTFYSLETVGREPAVRLEVNIAGAKTLYPADTEPPSPLPGFNWVKVRFGRKPGVYERANKPYATFEELAANVEKRGAPSTQRVVNDERGVANFIYGYEKNLPPINPQDKGHYHPESCEFWLIMSGQIRYPIENQGVIIANQGDLVYVPKFTYHLPRWYGPGPSCRLAMNGYFNIAHLFEAQ